MHEPAAAQHQNDSSAQLDDNARVEAAAEAMAALGSMTAVENTADNAGTSETTGDAVEMQKEENTTEAMEDDNPSTEMDANNDAEAPEDSGEGEKDLGKEEKATEVAGDEGMDRTGPVAGLEEKGTEAMDVDGPGDEKKQESAMDVDEPEDEKKQEPAIDDEAEDADSHEETFLTGATGGGDTKDEEEDVDVGSSEEKVPTDNKEQHDVTKDSSEAEAKTEGETTAQPESGTGIGTTSGTGIGTTSGTASEPVGASAPAAAPAASAPPPPVLRGTLSFNEELRRHIIRGMWNYENSTTFPPQRFELIRNLGSDEDPKVIPKDGEFHGSFSLAYFHTTSKGKQKERSKVIPESGVNIKFTKVEGKDNEYKVDGKGTNQFGIFFINGDAKKSPHVGDASYDVELRKRYDPTTAPAPPPVASHDGANHSSKKSKKRKHGEAGLMGEVSPDEDAVGENESGPLPPPSKSFPSQVVCLRGKMSTTESDDLGIPQIVERIEGLWAPGLDLILKDPQNVNGLCNRFEYEHKSSHANNQFPVSGRYTGWFDLTNPDKTRSKIMEKDVTLKFRKNSEGYYNVEGRGSNAFGKYSITGTLTLDKVITIFRHFQVKKPKKSKETIAAGSVTSAPPPLNDPSKSVSRAQAPPEPKLKLEDVVIPGDDGKSDTLEPIPPPAHGTYSAVSRGVLRLNEDGAQTCSGKWAMTREHYNNAQTSDFNFRLEPHYAAEAAAAMRKASGTENEVGKEEKPTSDSTAVSLSAAPPGSMVFPVDSPMYKGSFRMKRGPNKYTKVIDQQIVLKFRKNSQGAYNVYGKGINSIGEFNLLGTLILSGKSSGHVELYRVYPVPPAPAQPPASATDVSTGKSAAAHGKASHFPKLPTKSAGAGAPTLPARPRPSLQRRESSSRMVKLPSRLEEDDPEAMLARSMEKCGQILRFMHEKDIATGAFFREPVDPVALGIPNYYQVITEPMDLGTIQKKMDTGEITSPEEFGRLVRLIFENAIAFNENPAHAVHIAARNLLIIFNQKFRDVERTVENIRRSHKPSEAERLLELKRKEKEEAKKAKRKAKDDKRGKSAKRARLDEAHAMAAANASAMDAIVAAAPSNSAPGATVTRSEFNLLLQMMQKLQGQVVQTYTLLANLSSRDADDATSMSASAMSESESVFVPPSVIHSRPAGEKKSTKKKNDSGGAKAAEKMANFAVEESKPLSLKEQEALTETINLLPPERLPGVIQIIRESTHLNGDEEEIDLELDRLDTATQRKLQRYVLQHVKPARRSKPKAKKAKGGARKSQSPPKKSAPTKKSQSTAHPQAGADSFFAFGSKGDSDSDVDSDAGDITKQNNATSAPKDQFNLGATLQDVEDDEDDIANGGIAANWDISKTAATSTTKNDDDDLWGAAREEAAAAKAREEERKAREEKIRAEAEVAKTKNLADAAARGDEIRAQRMEKEEKEARLREQQEKEAEEARKAAREQARAQVQSVEQTVDLDAQRDIMKQYEQSFLDKENGGGASPSSDFGF